MTVDQRGYSRPVDGDGNGGQECDIGAFEAEFIAIVPRRVYSDGFESGGSCRWSTAVPIALCPPQFDGITLMAATDTDEILIAWAPASDGNTSPGEITYRVHLSTVPGFQPGPSTLAATIVGGEQVVVQGLSASTTYHALVIAEDMDGLASPASKHRSISTPDVPPVLSETTPLQYAGDLLLGAATEIGSDLVFQRGAQTVAPTTGSVLIGPLVGGGGFIRQVQGVTTTQTQVIVNTSPASIENAVDQIHMLSSGKLINVDQAVSKSLGNKPRALEMKSKNLRLGRLIQPDGSRLSRIDWANGILSMQTTRHAGSDEDLEYGPGIEDDRFNATVKAANLGKVTLMAEVDFTPELITDAKWTLAGVRSAEVIARGTLHFEALAKYEWNAAASYERTIPIFTTSWVAVYSAGPVPVYQKITLSVEAQISASASAEVVAQALAEATSVVEVGARYDKSTGWQPVSSFDFDRSLNADLSVKGSVEGEIRIIPKLEVEFYEAIAAWISVEPSLNAALTAEGTLAPTCAPIQMTGFDVDLEVDAKVGLDFTLFGTYPLFEATVWDPAPWPLFSLPELSLSSSGIGPVSITADVSNGTNNPFNLNSTDWTVTPGTGQLTETSPTSALLTCTENDTYSVVFSGYGVLGPLARQCVAIDVWCGPGGVPRLGGGTQQLAGRGNLSRCLSAWAGGGFGIPR